MTGFNVTDGGYGESYGDGMLGGGIQVFGASNCTVANNIAYDNDACGISLVNANNNTIANNTCIRNWIGVRLWAWSPKTTNNNIIDNNTLSENSRNGIELWSYVYMTWSVSNNNLTRNLVSYNGVQFYAGIDIGKSNGDVVSENTIFSNYEGIQLDDSSNCFLFHNDFIDNNQQVVIHDEEGTSVNQWDNGYPSGGNYWSDYNGTDNNADNIGDFPRVINSNNQDRYPLMTKHGTFEATLKLIDFTNSFKDNNGVALYTIPSSFRLLSPNGTESSLETGAYWINPGPAKIVSVTWQGTEVMTEVPFAFNSAEGNPSVNCRVYSLTVDPTFYTIGNSSEPVNVKSWSISFPNQTLIAVSSAVTFNQTQCGYYQLQDIFLDSANFTYLSDFMVLTANTVWAPRIGICTVGNNKTLTIDSNSTITEPAFDSSKQILSFTASGLTGTSGYIRVFFADNFAANPQCAHVFVDGQHVTYYSVHMVGGWLLSFNYTHSTHNIAINFGLENEPSSAPLPVGGELVSIDLLSVLFSRYSLAIVLLIVLLVTFGLLKFGKEKRAKAALHSNSRP